MARGLQLRLLRETELTIAEIAARTGFPDQSYFDRRFKQAFGKSPRQFRTDLTKRIAVANTARAARKKRAAASHTDGYGVDDFADTSLRTPDPA